MFTTILNIVIIMFPHLLHISSFVYFVTPVIEVHSIITPFILSYMSTLLYKKYHHLSVAKVPLIFYNSNTFTVFFHNNQKNTFSSTLLTILREFPKYSGYSGPYIDLSHTLRCQSRIIGLIDAVYSILLNN